jgi:ubiquinone/menaquinone biosynthesis C-methylase UbiE
MTLIQKALITINKILSRKSNVDIYRNDFDSCAVEYDAVPTRKLLGKFTEDVLRELNIKPGMCCIDLGCGTGHATEIIDRLVRPNGRVVGCDISKPMLEVAKKRLGSSSVTEFINQDMLTFLHEQQNNSVDLITAFWAIGYSEPSKILKEIGRVLAKSGYVAILVNTQKSLSELQKLVTNVLLRHPFVLEHIPPINFPSDINAFRRMLKPTGLSISALLENSCEQSFNTGESLISWVKTAGPCAGFRSALKENKQEFVFNKIEEMVDQKGGIKLTFRFIRFIGKK